MAKAFDQISPHLQAFIERQHIFFVATAAPQGRVNVSPKGLQSLRVLGPREVAWLNVTGSGNETAAHLALSPRMTLMFCAFEGAPLIVRLYGTARTVQPGDAEWDKAAPLFSPLPGARQVYFLAVDLVQTSCGMAVPLMAFSEERGDLNRWAERKTAQELQEYQQAKNRLSIDGFPAHLPLPNLPGEAQDTGPDGG